MQGEVSALRLSEQRVDVRTALGDKSIEYDYLVYAAGSSIDLDSVKGAREHGSVSPAKMPRAPLRFGSLNCRTTRKSSSAAAGSRLWELTSEIG